MSVQRKKRQTKKTSAKIVTSRSEPVLEEAVREKQRGFRSGWSHINQTCRFLQLMGRGKIRKNGV